MPLAQVKEFNKGVCPLRAVLSLLKGVVLTAMGSLLPSSLLSLTGTSPNQAKCIFFLESLDLLLMAVNLGE
jgi:hypothetical protein